MAETETSASRDRDETKTLTIFLETRPRRDVGTSRDRDVETGTTTLATTLTSRCFHVDVFIYLPWKLQETPAYKRVGKIKRNNVL